MDDSNDLVSMVISNCEFTHNPEINIMLHEEEDKEKFIPDGKIIAYVKSNFCELYHSDYKYLDKKFIQQNKQKNCKGRKPMIRETRRKKLKCGSGDEFGSSIAFGLIHEDRTYEMRVFRKTTIGVSGLKSDNIEFIKLLIDKLINYLNGIDPNLQIKIKDEPVITLCNLKYHFKLSYSTFDNRIMAFNLYRLMHIMNDNYNDINYWYPKPATESADADTVTGCDVPLRVLMPYNGMSTFYSLNIKCNDTSYYFKFYSNGKLNVYGGNNSTVCELLMKKFINILDTHKDHLIQLSIPTGNSTETEHEC